MKITEVVEDPIFIKHYIEEKNDIDNISIHYNEFKEYLLSANIVFFGDYNDKTMIKLEVSSNNYGVIYFVDWYIDNTRCDAQLNCKYTDILDIPKNTGNELFNLQISFDDNNIQSENMLFYIDSIVENDNDTKHIILKSI